MEAEARNDIPEEHLPHHLLQGKAWGAPQAKAAQQHPHKSGTLWVFSRFQGRCPPVSSCPGLNGTIICGSRLPCDPSASTEFTCYVYFGN